MIVADNIYALFKPGQDVIIDKNAGFWRVNKHLDKETIFRVVKNIHGTIVLYEVNNPGQNYWVSISSVLPAKIPEEAFSSSNTMLAFLRLLLRGSCWVDTVDNDVYLAGLGDPDFDDDAATDDGYDDYDAEPDEPQW